MKTSRITIRQTRQLPMSVTSFMDDPLPERGKYRVVDKGTGELGHDLHFSLRDTIEACRIRSQVSWIWH